MIKVFQWAMDVTFHPPRVSYDPNNTACVITGTSDALYIGTPIVFYNEKNQEIHGTLWHSKAPENNKSCLIFLHSLGTNQFEALNLISFMVTSQLSLFSFDFPGCGISEGDCIPLDGSGTGTVLAAYDILKSTYGYQSFAVWGRSMGASIALQTSSVSHKFACVVSDSAYASINDIVRDQGSINGFPSLFVNMIIPFAKGEAQRSFNLDITCQSPFCDIPYATTPLLMGHGRDDNFVPVSQARKIFDHYGFSDKQLYIFDGKHNTARPFQWFEAVSRFVFKRLGLQHPKRDYYTVQARSSIHKGPQGIILKDILGEEEYQRYLSEQGAINK